VDQTTGQREAILAVVPEIHQRIPLKVGEALVAVPEAHQRMPLRAEAGQEAPQGQ